tara:strand:+ start:9815 stop:10525 length:711 start_codon:yes stop_codon:yes gene_type:complete
MPKLVLCINPKNYNLTRGNEYEVEVDPNNANRYSLRNDRNLNSRYNTNLFVDVVVAPPVVRLSLDRVLASVEVSRTTAIFSVIEGENLSIEFPGPELSGRLTISCGLKQLSNIGCYDIITRRVNEAYQNIDVAVTRNDVNAIANKIFSSILTSIFLSSNTGGIISSTNTNSDYFEELNEVMMTFPVSVSRVHNPNSGNEIITYVFDMEAQNNINPEVDMEDEDGDQNDEGDFEDIL